MKPKYIIGGIFLCLLTWALSGIWGCNGIINSAATKNSQPFRNLGDSAHYVGIAACKGCHSDKHATFIETGMGQSFHLAERKYSKADFNNVKPVYDKKNDLYYYPFWKNERLHIQEFKLRGRDTIHNRIEQISHIIGSGQHTNSHFWMDGQHLFQAPLTFYTQKGIWDLPPGYEDFNTHFNRKIDIECMSCHTGMPQTKEGSVNIFNKLPLGIDCERCHGPGSLHIKEKTSGIIYNTNKQADYSIVNPKRLPWKLQVDICQRCHLQGNNVLKPGKKFTDFRPGMHLDSIFTVYMPSQTGNNPFVMAGHAERFQMSACFKGSNKGDLTKYNADINFTCINCHNPHVSVKKTNQDRFNQTCVSCHQPKTKKSKYDGCSLSTSMRGTQTCVGCHMPSSDTRDIPHVSIHDHYISRTNTNFNLQTNTVPKGKAGQTIGLHAVNSQHPSNEELFKAYVSYFEKFDSKMLYLDKAKSLYNDPSADLATKIQYHYNLREHASIIEIWENGSTEEQRTALLFDAWTQYRIAKAYDLNIPNQSQKALQYYEKSCEAMPWNTDFTAEYTNALVRANRIGQAKELILAAIKHQPKNELLHFNLGNCYYHENNISEAIKELETARSLNPKSQSILILIDIYYKTAPQKAKALFDEAKKWADPKILQSWSF